MRFLIISLLAGLIGVFIPAEVQTSTITIIEREDCHNALDDDGDGLIDLRDPDCVCQARPLPFGSQLIFNGGFEELADTPDCVACISLFASDNCPLGWEQESINLHTPCFTDANPSMNIGYVNGAVDNYQGVGGYGTSGDGRRQQEEYLRTELLENLNAGQAYRFAASLALPIATIPGINEAAVHHIAILGSRTGTNFIRTADSCYADDPNWDQLAVLEVEKRSRAVLVNRSTSFVARDNYRYLAIASDCCQPGEDTLSENLTYWAIDNVSLKAADLSPIQGQLQLITRGCDQDLLLCAEAPGNDLSYQWYQDSVALVDETNTCLSLSVDIARGQNFSVWISSSDNCQILSIELAPDLDCAPQPENCTNGVDDDGDGLADELDEDCDCTDSNLDVQISADASQIQLGEASQLQLMINQSEALISWQPAEGLSCTNCPNPSAMPLRNTTYVASIINPVTGCMASDSIEIEVEAVRAYFAPSAFSPNLDGINDQWQFFPGPAVQNVQQLRIFDRWGNLIYESTDAQSWDGRSQGKLLSTGLYIYQLQLLFLDGTSEVVSGELMLVE